MIEVPSSRKQRLAEPISSALPLLWLGVRAIAAKRNRPYLGWFGGALLGAILLSWNWKLAIATGAGMGGTILFFVLPANQWHLYWQKYRRFLQGSQGKMTLAAGAGGMTALSTYVLASAWADSENRWLAIASIVQALGTAAVLGLMLWRMADDRDSQGDAQLTRWLGDLTATDDLKRLIAIRQLARLVDRQQLSAERCQELVEYFCAMLVCENHPPARQALLEALQRWQVNIPQETASPLKLKMPLALTRVPLRQP